MTQSNNSDLIRPVSLQRRFLQSTSAHGLLSRSAHARGPVLRRLATLGLMTGLMAGLAACGSQPRTGPATVEIRGTDPGGRAIASAPQEPETSSQPRLSADGNIVDHGNYQTAIARRGDTVSDIAGRIGISATELAAYNGLTPTHELRQGDELVLPRRPDGHGGIAVADAGSAYPAPAESAIDVAPLPSHSGPDQAAPAQVQDVEDGGWSPDLAAAAIERSAGLREDGSLGAPPSSSEPMPPEPPARRELESPDLARYQTGTTTTPEMAPTTPASQASSPASAAPSGMRMIRPVEGRVALAFNKTSGSGRNDGVDFATQAGAPVKAAADGEVALVSKSLGGLGTIVLVRHDDELLTVYGRVDDVSVQKGDQVNAGQRIGVVSAATGSDEPLMHFEVRRGAESLDPMLFLPG